MARSCLAPCLLGFAAGTQPIDRLGERVMEDPDVAGIADEVEALGIELDTLLDGRHKTAKRLLVPVGGGGELARCVLERLALELTRDAERHREIEMADPKAVDAGERGER